MKTHAFRLLPGTDLRIEIDEYVKRHSIAAGVILTCVGNLAKATLRMADSHTIKTFEGSFEIVSLVGTLEVGNSHLHISVSDSEGNVVGGHLKQGSEIGVTAEIVIGELEGKKFLREFDSQTGFDELVVE